MNDVRINDMLTGILNVGELNSRIICRPILPAPWGLLFPRENKAYFHIIKKGSCFFYPKNKTIPLTLHQGDVLFVPKVDHYRLCSSKEIKGNNYIDELNRLQRKPLSDTQPLTRLICGSYELSANMSLPFFSLLPNYIHLSNDDINRFPDIGQVIQLIMREDSSSQLGCDLLITRLIDVLLVQIIRIWLTLCNADSPNWLLATLHTEIGQVLSLIHKRPEEKWTLDSLAKEVAISRTKLFNKFTKTVGISPILYLSNWRIDLSKQRLVNTRSSILEVANSVGYDSEASFGRAFRKHENISPGKYRTKMRLEY